MTERRGEDEGSLHPNEGDLPPIPPEWGPIVIPDDPRELADEAEQVRAELAEEVARARRWPFRRAFDGPLSLPLISLVLMLIAALASLAIVVLPSNAPDTRNAPLANPSTRAGEVGGLLPSVTLRTDDNHPAAVRRLRPAILLLLPAGCECASLATDLAKSAAGLNILVGLVSSEDKAAARPQVAKPTRVLSLVDPDQLLTTNIATEDPGQPTAVLVRSDGTIARIIPTFTSTDARALKSELAGLTAG